MLGIYADMIKTATRQKDWDAPQHWVDPHDAPPVARAQDRRDNHQMRRWLRDSGTL